MLRLGSSCGIAVMRAICFPSNNRRANSWRLVGRGLVWQVRPGLLCLCRDAGKAALRSFGDGAGSPRRLSQDGTKWMRVLVTGRTAGVPGALAAEGGS